MALTMEEKSERLELFKQVEVAEVDQEDYVFVSYKSDDWQAVFKDIIIPLQNRGLKIYCDKDFGIRNNSWIDLMQQRIKSNKCKAILCFVSKDYVLSYATLLELLVNRFNDMVMSGSERPKPVIVIELDDKEYRKDKTNAKRSMDEEVSMQGKEIVCFSKHRKNFIFHDEHKSGYEEEFRKNMRKNEKGEEINSLTYSQIYYDINDLIELSGGDNKNYWDSVSKDIEQIYQTIYNTTKDQSESGSSVFKPKAKVGMEEKKDTAFSKIKVIKELESKSIKVTGSESESVSPQTKFSNGCDISSTTDKEVKEKKGLTETGKKQVAFWTAFKDYCNENGVGDSIGKMNPLAANWYSVKFDKSKFTDVSNDSDKPRFHFEYTITTKNTLSICIYTEWGSMITKSNPHVVDPYINLYNNKSMIEEVFSNKLEWNPGKSDTVNKRIIHTREAEVFNTSAYPEMFKWMLEQYEILYKALVAAGELK